MKRETVLITGASSGIGREMAKQLSHKGYDLIIVARREERLRELASELKTNCRVIVADLTELDACYSLYEETKNENITMLINNAGFGLVDDFVSASLEKELEMIRINIQTLDVLSNLFLQDFVRKDYGSILNVSSIAGLMPGGPYMASYYATKAYVTSLSLGINQELREANSQVYIGALSPGPVSTEFDDVAGSSFSLKSITAQECAMYGISQMFKKKTIIIPGTTLKMAAILAKVAPRKLVVKIAGYQQMKKRG